MAIIRVMVAENDHTQIQELCNALDKEGSVAIVAIVSSRQSAVKQLTASPDVILLNPEILKGHTLSRFVRSVQTKSPRTKIMYRLRETSSDEDMIADINTGVRGFLRVTDPTEIMIQAIHAVSNGKIWAEPRIVEKAASNPIVLPETLQAIVAGLPPLTNREREMLALILQGKTNKEMAGMLRISERTVKTHLYRAYRKLNVKSRAKVVALLSHP
jgi:DNA-binding NarL/FixJ family response regulator